MLECMASGAGEAMLLLAGAADGTATLRTRGGMCEAEVVRCLRRMMVRRACRGLCCVRGYARVDCWHSLCVHGLSAPNIAQGLHVSEFLVIYV